MTLTIEIKPNIEARIFAEASARGVPVEELVREIIENNFLEENRAEISFEEFEKNLDLLAENFVEVSSYTGTHSREDIYLDHD